MTVWSETQLNQVRSLRVAVDVDPLVLDRNPSARQAVHEDLARRIRNEAHAHAVEIHPGDLDFAEQGPWHDWFAKPEDDWLAIRFVCHWQPSTTEIELLGEGEDGSVYTFDGAPEQDFLVHRIGRASDGSVRSGNVAFRLVGWHEDERRWVYAAR